MSQSDWPTAVTTPNRLNVAFITQWFPPEPVQAPLWIPKALARQGLNVSILTGIPNFPTGKVHTGFSPWKSTREVRDGFQVQRSPLYPSHDESAVGRTANYLSYALSSSFVGASLLRAADVSLVYSSPATAATAAMFANVRCHIPYVLFVQDLWPDSVFDTGFLSSEIARRVAHASLTWFTEQTYRRAAHIAVISPGMRALLIDRGVSPGKVSVVYNWADESIMRPSKPDKDFRLRLGFTDDFILMYGGNLGAAQALDVAIRSMDELRDLPEIQLVIIGEGIEKPRLRLLAQELHLRSVHFLDPVAPDEMPALMAAADIQLICLANRNLFRITLPSKVQSILACGQPIVASTCGDSARIIDEAGAGFVAPPGDPVALSHVIRKAHRMSKESLRNMGDMGLHYYRTTLSEATNAHALADLLTNAARAREPAASG